MMKIIVAAVTGIILGVIGSRYFLVGSWLSLIPWGIAGILLGWWSKRWNEAVINGLVYGFFLCFSFMIAGYNGSASILSRTPFFAIIGLFGALCGLVLELIGAAARRVVLRNR